MSIEGRLQQLEEQYCNSCGCTYIAGEQICQCGDKLRKNKAKLKVNRDNWKTKALKLQAKIDACPVPNRQVANGWYVGMFEAWKNGEAKG